MAFVTGLMGPYMSPIPINSSFGMLISLAIAFIVTPWLSFRLLKKHAGTPAVLSTLWEIDDIATTALMDAFYERFVSGLPAADALREAQLSMLRGDVFPSPRLWAAFTLNGDPQGTWRQVSP